jgi:hypothetical protein
MFEKSQEDGYLDLCVSRAQGEYLGWVEQFLEIIEEENFVGVKEISDIGCNVGQFWKGLKRRDHDQFLYSGFDYEKKYLEAALNIFPELEGRLHNHDLTKDSLPDTDITVCSATIEHLPSLEIGLNDMIKSTRNVILLRTFLGESQLTSLNMKQGAKEPYLIHQFSFHDIFSIFSKAGFKVTIIRDKYTDSMPRYLATGIVRTFYVVKAVREM